MNSSSEINPYQERKPLSGMHRIALNAFNPVLMSLLEPVSIRNVMILANYSIREIYNITPDQKKPYFSSPQSYGVLRPLILNNPNETRPDASSETKTVEITVTPTSFPKDARECAISFSHLLTTEVFREQFLHFLYHTMAKESVGCRFVLPL